MFYTLLNSNQNLRKRIVQYHCSYLLYCGKLELEEKFNTVINELKTFYIEKLKKKTTNFKNYSFIYYKTIIIICCFYIKKKKENYNKNPKHIIRLIIKFL